MTMIYKVVFVVLVLSGVAGAGAYLYRQDQRAEEYRAKEAAREEAGRQLRSGTFDIKPGQSW
jgi:hypothetical protein